MILPNFKELITKKECVPITHYTAKYINGKWYASNGKKKYLIDNWEIEETPNDITIYSRPDNKNHLSGTKRLVAGITSKSLNAINGGWSKLYEDMNITPEVINTNKCMI